MTQNVESFGLSFPSSGFTGIHHNPSPCIFLGKMFHHIQFGAAFREDEVWFCKNDTSGQIAAKVLCSHRQKQVQSAPMSTAGKGLVQEQKKRITEAAPTKQQT